MKINTILCAFNVKTTLPLHGGYLLLVQIVEYFCFYLSVSSFISVKEDKTVI